ncbi:tRNA (guanosine(37)-N1)-methyltransferase TrmD [Planctobacterium marinum]|uniref:tRNA (guanosine(37)-N1)-methyltransferase TrmD n=1 Tax=Planctobacterium marinum TaxID=1631968 RepID=UPI001E3215EB|nr:tRNA (guanosine(37)-N1)-methyltransferase TrmD [Planctobacterium marinum]MCC2604500.1 tRNA (guanosine(37)-N1)-methyltransferase TrmD [Planctobacterium marinum]
MSEQHWFGFVTLFPDMFDTFLNQGVIGRAVKSGLIHAQCFNPRDFTHDKHRTVDDRPYGGGPGMLMMVQPLTDAINAAQAAAGGDARVIYLSPQGSTLNQPKVKQLVQSKKLILVAGRYEGIDERVIQTMVDEEISLGDFVLSGGEIPAMALVDSVARLIPGVLGHELSAEYDSFEDGLLDCPHYTRPEVLNGEQVPAVLLSGNHEKIRRWRLKQSLGRTWQRRPDMFKKLALTEEQGSLLKEYQQEVLQQDDSYSSKRGKDE